MNPVALSAEAVRVELGSGADRVQALRGVDAVLPAACWTSIAGPNGAGKSTLLKTLAGLLPCQGRITLLDRPLAQWRPGERARALAWLGQNERAADELTVWDVTLLGRLPHRPWLAPPGPQDRAVAEECLRATQAWEWRERALGQLSGGERQRVLLARALAVQAPVLLMDEPLANLDPPHQADWIALVRRLVRQGRTVVSVLHEVGVALQADRLLVLDRGQVAHQGPCADAAAHRALERVFEGRIRIHPVAGQWAALPHV